MTESKIILTLKGGKENMYDMVNCQTLVTEDHYTVFPVSPMHNRIIA